MKVLRISASLLVLASVAAIGQELSEYSYSDSAWGTVKVTGVCEANPEKIHCWKPDGSPNPDLEELSNAYFLVNPQQTLNLRYKHRSLLIAVESQVKQGVYANQILADPGTYLNASIQIGNNGAGSDTTNLYWYYPADDLTSLGLTSHLQTNGDPVDVPIQAGSTTKLHDATISILDIKELKPTEFNSNSNDHRRRWKVTYNVDGPNAKSYPVGYVQLFDKQGQPIQNVDDKGKPIVNNENNGWFPSRTQPVQPQPGAWILTADPAYISKVVVTEQRTNDVKFAGIKLQPK